MKIYKRFESNATDKSTQIIEKLVNNNLTLRQKMIQLMNSLNIVKHTSNGENMLIEMLMQGIGAETYFPRKGDNSERFDAIFNFQFYEIVAEIEIPSTEILDAPRNLLDDYAVLKCRKNVNDKELVPLVICWDLPNRRTDYWNVITDINKILGVKIKTISILALALHYWTNTPIDFQRDDYYLDYEHLSMRFAIKLLANAGLLMKDFPGYFSPFK